MPDNFSAWQLWGKVNTQWRVGFSVVGLDYTAVLQTAAVYAITITPKLLDKIRTLEHDTLQEVMEKHDAKTTQRKYKHTSD